MGFLYSSLGYDFSVVGSSAIIESTRKYSPVSELGIDAYSNMVQLVQKIEY